MAPPLRSSPLQRLPAHSCGFFIASGFQAETPYACRFSKPLGALQLGACRSCFRSDPLVGFFSSELCSSHAAVRRFQRRYPHAVGPKPTATTEIATATGNALVFRVLLHVIVHHFQIGGLDRTGACSSLEILPLQGSLPRWNGVTFITPPLSSLAVPGANDRPSCSSGSCFQTGLAGPSRSCRPSWGSWPSDHHSRSDLHRLGSHLLRDRGTSPPSNISSLSLQIGRAHV